jgi:3-oxosteroid 1-dehydrogenase
MTDNAHWDYQTDVLVVGSGAGGMTAAIRAHDLGARALLIEKSEYYGGSTALSGGVVWIPNNHMMAGTGISDSDTEAFDYIKTLTLGQVPDARIKAYIAKGKEMLLWVMNNTRAQFMAMDVYPDYYPGTPGFKAGSRSCDPLPFDGRLLGEEFDRLRPPHPQVMVFGLFAMTAYEVRKMFQKAPGWIGVFLKTALQYSLDIKQRLKNKRSRRTTLGNGVVASLRMSMLDRDIPLWLNCGLKELITENGRVVGVLAERDGKPVRIRAEKAVVAAAGGFESNQAMREQYLPQPTRAEWTAANPANTGDVIRAGIAIGAATDFMDEAWWGPTVRAPGEQHARMMIIEKALPGCLFVNKAGKRFTNEAAPYIQVIADMYAAHNAGVESVPAWMVFGGHYRRKYPMGPLLPGENQPDVIVPKKYWDTFIYKADTPEALAAKIGVDAVGLRQSIDNMTRYAQTGVDEEFGKGGNENDLYYGDATVTPNPCLAPVEAPFYAVQIFPGELGTKGGLLADEFARVLDKNGAPIEGFYVTGNCSASVTGPTYPGAGSTIGPSMTFGYVAVNHAMDV